MGIVDASRFAPPHENIVFPATLRGEDCLQARDIHDLLELRGVIEDLAGRYRLEFCHVCDQRSVSFQEGIAEEGVDPMTTAPLALHVFRALLRKDPFEIIGTDPRKMKVGEVGEGKNVLRLKDENAERDYKKILEAADTIGLEVLAKKQTRVGDKVRGALAFRYGFGDPEYQLDEEYFKFTLLAPYSISTCPPEDYQRLLFPDLKAELQA